MQNIFQIALFYCSLEIFLQNRNIDYFNSIHFIYFLIIESILFLKIFEYILPFEFAITKAKFWIIKKP